MSNHPRMKAIRKWATGYGTWTINEQRLAQMVLDQEGKIERLRAGIAHALYFSAESIDDLILQGIITEGDMKEPQ